MSSHTFAYTMHPIDKHKVRATLSRVGPKRILLVTMYTPNGDIYGRIWGKAATKLLGNPNMRKARWISPRQAANAIASGITTYPVLMPN